VAELIAGIFNGSRYKRNQGRMARQLTFVAMAALVAVGAFKMSELQIGAGLIPAQMADTVSPEVFGRFILPSIVLGIGAWLAYRIVNVPRFAEFLISVENEMGKVSWPSRTELFRSSLVVLVVIFVLTAILLAYDLILRVVIGWLLGTGGGEGPM